MAPQRLRVILGLFGTAVAGWFLLPSSPRAAEAGVETIVVEGDLTLTKGEQRKVRLVVRASHVVIDGRGATMVGPGTVGDPKSLEGAGVGVSVEGTRNVTIKNLTVKGFAVGLQAVDADALRVEGCDFSDNYHNPAHGWGELPARGGVILKRVTHAVLAKNKANRVWDGLSLTDCDDNTISDNDFSHCSNVCGKLWHSSRNRLLTNNFSYGIRIDRAKGEVHARDSTGVLIETGSDDNYWYRNDVTHGGDGIFVRVLNGWVSRGNVFVENDTSYANNNCVESWSPGNTYIRNTANHGSYGFWLGGSDHTRLIGNEAAHNGLATGYHHAPEPGFRHGGIVCVNGPGSHFVLDGNHVHHNGGGGIVFRGDLGSKGKDWRIRHWVVQNNRSHDNVWGVYGQHATDVYLGRNTFEKNERPNFFEDVTDLREAPAGEATRPPVVKLTGPVRAVVGRPVRFDATGSTGPGTLAFRWDIGGVVKMTADAEHVFTKPGFYRVGLTVDHGGLAEIGSREVIVTEPVEEIGTEGEASRWGFEFGDDPGKKGRMHFEDVSDAVTGGTALKLWADPYPGFLATAIFPKDKSAAWDWSRKTALGFWIQARNPNLPGWQDAGPVLTLYGPTGKRVIKPVGGKNLLGQAGESEYRWLWQRLEIPLTVGKGWEAKDEGAFDLGRVTAIGLSVDSWGADPFTLWLDGLGVK